MTNNLTITVIQARMSSERLPGKSLMEISGNMSLLEVILRRVRQSEKSDFTVLATSDKSDCNVLAKLGQSLGCKIIRGDEVDVLSRFILAIDKFKPVNIVRVCADNPFVSPVEIDKLITFFNLHNLDYAANNTRECGLPDGFGAEIVKSVILKNIYHDTNSSQKEHVTQYVLDNPDRFRIAYLKADKELFHPEIKLDIDEQDDLEKIRNICRLLDDAKQPYWNSKEIITHA